jgi:hypothetical protein
MNNIYIYFKIQSHVDELLMQVSMPFHNMKYILMDF